MNKYHAVKLGRDQATISTWVKNSAQPSLETLIQIPQYLDIDVHGWELFYFIVTKRIYFIKYVRFMEWTREQEIVALYLCCMIPFNKVNNSNSQVAEMAELIGRPNANSLKAKIGNFGRFDTNLNASGLGHTSHLDEEIWNEFNGNWQELEIQALKLIQKFQQVTHKKQPEIIYIPIGKEREVVIKQRTNQYLFRNMVLSAYCNTCCITRISRQELIEACHIVDWKTDEKNRINPCNGLAMNVLFHRAYDKQLIGITPDFKVEISERMYDGLRGDDKEKTYSFFNPYNNTEIVIPKKFKPNRIFIEKQYEIFKKAN